MTGLYRCKTPTNSLCACGKARACAEAKGIDFDQVRVPYRKSQRPEVEDLTRQRWVPVLVHGEDVIHDSKPDRGVPRAVTSAGIHARLCSR